MASSLPRRTPWEGPLSLLPSISVTLKSVLDQDRTVTSYIEESKAVTRHVLVVKKAMRWTPGQLGRLETTEDCHHGMDADGSFFNQGCYVTQVFKT